MLWVYEIEGGHYPGDVPASGLAGIWREGRYYYLFNSRDAGSHILQWI
ncbi:MAG: hypothetical protein LLG06_02630 [Desulfobacteraceae bacterium]|nr:hypothetical protein [Desulfobacteraceae bacterium]